MATETDARRAGRPTAMGGPGRPRLGKRAWRDVRRAARTLGIEGNLYAAEINGVKLFFRWPVAHNPPVEIKGGTAATTPKQAADARRTRAQQPQPHAQPQGY